MSTEEVDVLIVGSGAAGATFARSIRKHLRRAKILMVDTGGQLTETPGSNLKNHTEIRTVPETSQSRDTPSSQQAPNLNRTQQIARGTSSLARQGTHLLRPESSSLPGAAMSTNVGGMAAHWTCATPRPSRAEQMPFLSESQWRHHLQAAERILHVTTNAFPEDAENEQIFRGLSRAFDQLLPRDRRVQPMPLACRVKPDGSVHWTGVDTILGPLVDELSGAEPDFVLRPQTLCTEVHFEDGMVAGASLKDLATGASTEVKSQVVVVTADALRTPQLLWASGVRPWALGRYFNDQPQVLSAVRLRASNWDAIMSQPGTVRSPAPSGGFWVPYSENAHPFHGQVMSFDMSSVQVTDLVDGPVGRIVALSWYCPKDIRSDDSLEFRDDVADQWGMPQIAIHQTLTDIDLGRVQRARHLQMTAADELGEFVDGREPEILPAGSSLHYQGSVRMGAVDDGTSVCGPDSQVWGVPGLYVGGNGVIATPIACNPTLTSLAMAIRASESIAGQLERAGAVS